MMRRLMAWCVPNAALQLRMAPVPRGEADPTDVEQVLAPYQRRLRVGGYRRGPQRLGRA